MPCAGRLAWTPDSVSVAWHSVAKKKRPRTARTREAAAAHLPSLLPLPLPLRTDDYLFILVLIGDSGVGKSCLLLRFAVRGRHHLHRRCASPCHGLPAFARVCPWRRPSGARLFR